MYRRQKHERRCRSLSRWSVRAPWLLEQSEPALLVTSYELSEEEKERITPKHAVVTSQFHIVLAVRFRKGFFGSRQVSCVAKEWLELQREMRFALLKIS